MRALPPSLAHLAMKPLSSPLTVPTDPRDAVLRRPDRGVTLVELLVVLTVLVALGGIVVSTMSRDVRIQTGDGTERSADEIVTLATMQAVRDALLGTSPTDLGFHQDLGRLPRRLGGLIDNLGRVVDSTVVIDPPYDPATKHGWRGPYIVGSGSRYEDRIVSGDGFPTTDPDDEIPAAILQDPAILDAWGKPLVLMQAGTPYARLVSAGPNRVLETDLEDPVDADRGDDLVLFLFSFDPNL